MCYCSEYVFLALLEREGGSRQADGRVYLFHLYTLRCFYVDFPREVFLALLEREGGSRQADGRVYLFNLYTPCCFYVLLLGL